MLLFVLQYPVSNSSPLNIAINSAGDRHYYPIHSQRACGGIYSSVDDGIEIEYCGKSEETNLIKEECRSQIIPPLYMSLRGRSFKLLNTHPSAGTESAL